MPRESREESITSAEADGAREVGGGVAATHARRSLAGALCDFQTSSTGLYGQADASAEASEHVNEGVRTEQVNPTAEKVADPRLRHAESFGGRLLLQAAGHDDLLDLDHAVRSD